MAILSSREPKKLKPRGDFDEESFRRLVFQEGAYLTWQQCSQCPCGRKVNDVATDMVYTTPLASYEVTGEGQTECVMCKGSGFIVHDSQTIRAIIQDMRTYGRRWNPGGEYGAGTARVTFLPEHKPSLGDRITVQNSVVVVRESRLRGTTTAEAMRFPIVSQALDLAGGSTTLRTLFAQKADSSNATHITDTLVEGTDYAVDSQGRIDWTLGIANGKAPAQNTYYTISYYANPRYVIIDLGFGVRDSWDGIHKPTNAPKFQTMPILAIARQEWLGSHGGVP